MCVCVCVYTHDRDNKPVGNGREHTVVQGGDKTKQKKKIVTLPWHQERFYVWPGLMDPRQWNSQMPALYIICDKPYKRR